MPRRLLFAILLLPFLGAVLSASSLPDDWQPADWQHITSEACRATFALPGPAQMDTTTQSLGGVGSSQVTRYKYATVVPGPNLYDVTCGIYPPGQLSTDEQRRAVLENMAERIAQKGELIESSETRMAGQPARQVVISVKGGIAFQYHRLVAVGNRIIILTAGRFQKTSASDDAALQRFFGSLDVQ